MVQMCGMMLPLTTQTAMRFKDGICVARAGSKGQRVEKQPLWRNKAKNSYLFVMYADANTAKKMNVPATMDTRHERTNQMTRCLKTWLQISSVY